LVFAAVYAATMWALAWVRRGTLGVETAAPYVLQQGALALTGFLAASGAFASVVPGVASRAFAAVAAPVALMMAALVWGSSRDALEFGTIGLGREADWPCVVSITAGALLLWAVLAAMLRRGAVLEPRVTSVLAGIAALSFANMEACGSRVHAFTATVIVWHGATAAALMLGLIAFGPSLLSRRRASEGRRR
jgi:hypothetical protein